MVVHVLIATGVYDQGVVGVFESASDARRAAEDIWPKTDGHHGFRIETLEVGHVHENTFEYASYYLPKQKLATGPARIEMVKR